MYFVVYIILTCWSLVVESTHFYGGTVTWKPMNNIANGSTVAIMITQSYQWRRSFSGAGCNQTTILNQSPLIPNTNDKLTCTTSSCGGYTAISINEYCTDFSELVDSSSGQISTVKNIIVGSKFCVAYSGSAWIKLYSTSCGSSGRKRRAFGGGGSPTTTTAATGCYSSSAGWSVGTCIDLTIRSDGFINTPPVATIISPIKVPVDSLTDITIPVIDADNDYLRCRWAENTNNLDECGDVCQAAPGSTLDEENCLLIFNSTGKNVGDYFAVTLMVEDFYNSTTDTAYSRVPIQFLVYIVDQTNCTSKPTISSTLPECSPIQVGIPFNFSLTIVQGCPGTTVTDIFTSPPENLFKVSFTQNGTNNVWILSETWTPTSLQLGSQVYCAVATDSTNVQSDQYCTTFTVVPAGSNSLCPGVTSTTSTTSTTTIATTSTSSSSTTSTVTTSSTTTSTSTSSTTATTTTTTSTESTTSTTTSATTSTTTTTSTSTSTSSTSTTSTTTSTSTSTSSTSSTSTTTTTSTTSTSSSTSSTSSTSTTTTTSTTSTSTSTSSTSSTTSTTSTSTSTSTTTSITTSTSTSASTTSVTTTTATTVTTTSVTTVNKIQSTTVASTINLPLIIGLSLLGLLALLALCCCCCWRFFGVKLRRHRRKQTEEKVTSKYAPFNGSISRKQNLLSSSNHKSSKMNQISVLDLEGYTTPRSRTITMTSSNHHTDHNLDTSTIVDETKSRRGKSSNSVHAINTPARTRPTTSSRSTPVPEIDDRSKVSELKRRGETIGSASSSTPSVRVIKVPREHLSSKPHRDETLSASSKSAISTGKHHQSNPTPNITITKIKRLDLPLQTTNETQNSNLFSKPDSFETVDVRKTTRSSTTTTDITVTKLKRSDSSSTRRNQSAITITPPKDISSVKFPRDRSHTNASSTNVTVTKLVRRKSLK